MSGRQAHIQIKLQKRNQLEKILVTYWTAQDSNFLLWKMDVIVPTSYLHMKTKWNHLWNALLYYISIAIDIVYSYVVCIYTYYMHVYVYKIYTGICIKTCIEKHWFKNIYFCHLYFVLWKQIQFQKAMFGEENLCPLERLEIQNVQLDVLFNVGNSVGGLGERECALRQ